ncbi:MAG: hypothetical protein LBV16_02165 [Elusimicrobiota bacterium]|jgi:hypothetical protein|nr:hypothetical protein [Elusimicrobiota bacterium]
MKKSFSFIRFLAAAIAIVFAVVICESAMPAPTPTGNSSEIHDILSGKNFLFRSKGFVRQSWYLTFNYDGTYIQTINGKEILKGTYSLSGATVSLIPTGMSEGADVFGQLQGSLDSAKNPTELKWNMSVYKLIK